ncbi:MAG: DUF1302 family protein [Acidiferrobacterales bacterium]
MSDTRIWSVLALGLILGNFWQAANAQIEINGYYKNLLAGSRTLASFFPPATDYTVDLNRLHLELKGDLSENTAFNVQYDNEIFLGDYLKTSQFQAQKNIPQDTYLNLRSTYLDNQSVFGRHGLYRAYLDTRIGNADLRIGRQRVAWGSALFWSPVDILNPIDPTALERDRRTGVDAVVLDADYSDLSRVSVMYAVHATPVRASTAVRWRTNKGGFDWGLSAGRFRNDDMAGIDLAGQIGKIGLRGEVTRTQSPVDGSYTRFVVGADYTFSNTITINSEFYFNGQGATDTGAYDFNRLFSGEIQSLAQRYLGLYLGYDITPLLKWKNYYINNLDDKSFFYSPEVSYSITQNSELAFGVQIYSGSAVSEYGSFENMAYGQWQLYF